MDVKVVLKIEEQNRRHIHLYCYKNRMWGCCGRSAVLLHGIYSNLPCREREVLNTGVIKPVMVIDHLTLKHLIDNIPPIKQSNDRIVIELPEELRFLYDREHKEI